MLPPPPPTLESLRAGATLRAGLGVSTILPDMDFETYSEAGLVFDVERQRWVAPPRAPSGKRSIGLVGAARYAEHPSTEVLCLSYDLKDGWGRRRWRPGQPPPQDLFDHIAAGGLIEAWHVGFERHVWEKICVPRMGWPPIPRRQYRCAMAKSRAHALPGGLAQAGAVLGAAQQKSKDGKRLLDLFSVPRNPTKGNPSLRNYPTVHPEGFKLYDYNEGDIIAEAENAALTPDLDPDELEWWFVDQEINSRGVAVDMVSVEACIDVVGQAFDRYNSELAAITNGAVQAGSEVAKLSAWLQGWGVYLPSMDEENVAEALKLDLPFPARRALTIRGLVGSASIKKLYAIEHTVCADNRLRDLYVFHGARTGRATGGATQPTNLPNHGPAVYRCDECGHYFGTHRLWCPWCGAYRPDRKPLEWSPAAVDDALSVMALRSLDLAESFWGDALPTISGCLRGTLVAAPGHDLISSDYSAIEAVVLAELAGEEWRKEVFRTHGKIYEASIAKITGVPLEEILDHRKRTGQHHPLRKKGKVAELALGYQGWIGALLAFDADEWMTEDEMRTMIIGWREESPAIVEFWGGQTRRTHWGARVPELYGLEGAWVSACLDPGREYDCRGLKFIKHGDVLYIRLLSGRLLTYHRPRLDPSDRRAGEFALSYEGWNSNPKNGPVGWIRMRTWGGRTCENVDQATARDIQRHGLIRQYRAGYHPVLHIYDENVAEVREGWGSVTEFEALMNDMPPFALGWPIKATGGWRGKRFRKES